jgi:hypothetical protein
MLKKTMTYTDFDGNERTEDFYFNLTKAEVMEMEMSETGGYSKLLEKIVAEQDSRKIIKNFKELILKSYGEKSLDGKKFVKSTELSEGFAQTNAFNDLAVELYTNAESAAAFVNAIIPQVSA